MERASSDPSPIVRSSEMLELINQVLRELHPGRPVAARMDSRLDVDLGLDSLARVELFARIERAWGVSLPQESIATVETPRDLLKALVAGRAAPGYDDSTPVVPDRDLPQSGLPSRAATLVDVLTWHVDRHPARTHVTFLDSVGHPTLLSYGSLLDEAGRLAAGLARRGVEPGDRVGMMLPSGLDFFRSFFGILFAGAVPVPLYPPARPATVAAHLRRQAGILVNCSAKLLIISEQARPVAGVLDGLVPDLREVITPDIDADAVAGTPVPSAPEALALIQYTSGSTGDPKGVALSHANLLANIRAWGEAIALSSEDVCVSWLPLYHDMGLIGAWLGSLYHACPLVLMSPLDFLARPERWLKAVHRYRGTVAASPNFGFDLCVRRLEGEDLGDLDLSSWRLAANGAEPVSPRTIERFVATFGRYGFKPHVLTPVYGLAECSVGLSVPRPGRGTQIDTVDRDVLTGEGRADPCPAAGRETLAFVSCGPPLPGHSVRIVDGDGRALPERHVGMLEFTGPSTTRGYFNNPDANRTLFRDGWLVSGDHAYLADGEIHITGRAKDVIIRGGRNLHPYELERAAGEIPGVRKGCVAVFGVQDPSYGADERLVVVAETAEQDTARREEMEQRIISLSVDLLDLPPDEVVLVPPNTIPKTSSGKLRRAATRDAHVSGELARAPRSAWVQFLRLHAFGLGQRLQKRLSGLAHALFGFWAWSCFVILGVVAVIGLVLIPSTKPRWAFSRALARLCARLVACPVTVEGLESLPAGDCVLVGNHASYIDGFVLVAGLKRPVRFVAKAEFKGNPAIRFLLERLGIYFVERFDAARSAEDVARLESAARGPFPLFVFAEGTFQARPGLKRFRLGAFRIAASQNIPVVPVTLTGTRRVLRDGSWLPHPGRIRIRIDEPVYPQGSEWQDMLALRLAVRNTILQHCGEMDLDDT